MDEADGLILFVVGSVVVVVLFLGIITGIKKAFKNNPAPQQVSSYQLQQEQRRRAQETAEQHKKMMRDLQQKSKDYQRTR